MYRHKKIVQTQKNCLRNSPECRLCHATTHCSALSRFPAGLGFVARLGTGAIFLCLDTKMSFHFGTHYGLRFGLFLDPLRGPFLSKTQGKQSVLKLCGLPKRVSFRAHFGSVFGSRHKKFHFRHKRFTPWDPPECHSPLGILAR